jgi:serine/threonine-protein kinase
LISSEGRFLPGRLLVGRYRIVALLGRGGMGEVYRADDLTLGQPVALKFLPEKAASDEAMLERFRNEVRIARRVSHPNVCRVYDVGEVGGHSFFTMEYVDGEDLASLLRRIGRLPSDKALEIARQLCAGLAAAHSRGVLHRDLKPANIMLDGRGQVVVTDFGLAGLADQIVGGEVRSGTPAYMAPEQLAGKEVNVKSDIYALGLVLYEVFTGRRAFSAESLPELVKARSESTLSRPSSVVKDLDPAVERVILRCLEPDPANRPGSVLSVAAALPGGDPLAAALAAGETPSPQMVAAAGETTGLAPRYALLCLAIAIVGLVFTSYFNIRSSGLEQLHPELSPEVLNQKAREIIQKLGYNDRPLDRAGYFAYDYEFLNYVHKNDKPRPQWDQILARRPSVLYYWYRQSPHYMLAAEFQDLLLTPDVISESDPPAITSGMVTVKIDPQGRLRYFHAMPAQMEDQPAPPGAAADWSALFSAAGLDLAQFQPTQPQWTSLATADSRMAWTGVWPGTNRPLRIEAAAWHGKPNYFLTVGPWTKPSRMEEEQPSLGKKVSNAVLLATFFLILVGATWQARRNYIQGRGDRDGALRLAVVVFFFQMLLWLCRAHFVLAYDMLMPFVIAISTSLFLAGLVLVMYLALEPYVRRHWPRGIISWSRLLMGQFRDPVVGRDALFGVLLGLSWVLIYDGRFTLMMRSGDSPVFNSADHLMGARSALGAWLLHIPLSIQSTLALFFVLLVFRILLRKEWLAAIAFVALHVLTRVAGSDFPKIEAVAQALIFSIAAIVVLRFGLVALAVGIFTADELLNVPLTADLSNWYAMSGMLIVLSIVALAVWSYYTTLGGRNPWATETSGQSPAAK